jgi:hypothetical protein
LQSKRLESYGKKNKADAAKMPSPDWNRTRKSMRADETRNTTNQAWE